MKHKFLQPFQGSRKWMTFALTAQLMVAASAAEGHPIEHKSTRHSTTTMVKGLFDVTITGTVTDANGKPNPGVTVMVSGTTIGTATDLDGKYSLEVPEGFTLTFSFIGYVTQNVPVGQQSTINITMTEDTASLDEVVVIGYGTAKKSDLTGSVARKAVHKGPTLPIGKQWLPS